jgi:hypothetical protein
MTKSAEKLPEFLSHEKVRAAAEAIRKADPVGLVQMLELGRALAEAASDTTRERILRAELRGYDGTDLEVPAERRVVGFASPFPVRAIGLLDPEEIFLANREKFSQVTLTIGQAVEELETALAQIRQGGVLALKVAAAEVSGEAAQTTDDTEVFIYILPREIERVVDAARRKALDALMARVVDSILGPAPPKAKDELDEDVPLEPTPTLFEPGVKIS